mgnify:FL=1
MNLFERVYGCLAGLALGDALGMPTEFLTREQIGKEFGWVDHPLRAPAWHPHHKLRAGQVTDDTGQALAVAHAYALDGSLTAEAVARELVAWSEQVGENLPLVVGPSTRLALEQIKAGGDPRKTGRKGTTNGASYRAVIVGLVNCHHPEDLIPQVVEACLPTHGTTTAISAGVAVASAVAQAMLEGASLESIFDAAQLGAREGRSHGVWAWGTPLEGRIELALKIVAESGSPEMALDDLASCVGVDMLVAESVATAFGLVSLAEGDVMLAVTYGANIGGDTDTMAAIAGAVCGAWQGIDALDGKILARVEKINKLDLKAEAERLVAIIDSKG